MRLKLDDNERGAFHYLIGGVLVVLVLRGAAYIFNALGPAPTPDVLALALFQHGYPGLRGELAVAGTSSGLNGRIVLAVVFSVVLAVGVAIICALVARLLGRRAGRTGAWVTRLVLIAGLGWSLWSAFFLPLKEARTTGGNLVLIERRAIVGDIPWPFSLHERKLGREQVVRMEAVEQAPKKGCDGQVALNLITAHGSERLAASGVFCAKDRINRLRAGSDAAALLERELR